MCTGANAAYLQHIEREARRRFDAGMPLEQAVLDIPLGEFSDWLDAERIGINVCTLYREFRDEKTELDVMQALSLAAEVWRQRRA